MVVTIFSGSLSVPGTYGCLKRLELHILNCRAPTASKLTSRFSNFDFACTKYGAYLSVYVPFILFPCMLQPIAPRGDGHPMRPFQLYRLSIYPPIADGYLHSSSDGRMGWVCAGSFSRWNDAMRLRFGIPLSVKKKGDT